MNVQTLFRSLLFVLILNRFTECKLMDNTGKPVHNVELGDNQTLLFLFTSLEVNNVIDFYFNVQKADNNFGSFLYKDGLSQSVIPNTKSTVPFIRNINGKCDIDKGNGNCELTIVDLKYDCTGKFFVISSFGPKKTLGDNITIDVKGGPFLCGDGTESFNTNFTCTPGEELSKQLTFCGKPQPKVEWKLDGIAVNGTVDDSKKDQHQYTYLFKKKVTTEMCGSEVSFTASGNGDSIPGKAWILMKNIDFKNIEFYIETNGSCPRVTWDKENYGSCKVYTTMKFRNSTGGVVEKKFVDMKNGMYDNCKIGKSVTRVSYKVTVIVTIDGKEIRLRDESDEKFIDLRNGPKTTVQTTTKTGEPLNKAYAIATAILAVVAGILVGVLCYLKRKYGKNERPSKPPIQEQDSLISEEEKHQNDYTNHQDFQQGTESQEIVDNGDYEGAASWTPKKSQEELDSMYASVNKEKPQPSIYSELGPGGGRVGPKPVIVSSNYAEAKDVIGHTEYSNLNE